MILWQVGKVDGRNGFVGSQTGKGNFGISQAVLDRTDVVEEDLSRNNITHDENQVGYLFLTEADGVDEIKKDKGIENNGGVL